MSSGPKTVELKVRVTPEQAAWLRSRADERYGGKVSEAIRSAVTDARVLEMAREDYRSRHGAHVDPETGESAAWIVVMGWDVTWQW
jgi:hypothetical protein